MNPKVDGSPTPLPQRAQRNITFIYTRKNAVITCLTCSATRLCHVPPRFSFYIMPLLAPTGVSLLL